MNKKIEKLLAKKNKSKIVSLTAYSKNVAKILDRFCDFVLVGDSMANVLYGHNTTHRINLENIIQHTISVKMGIKKSLLVVDMPKGTYVNVKTALKNAKQIIRQTKCDAIKLESNKKNYKIIEVLVKKKFKIQGTTNIEATNLLKEAKLIESAGAFSIVLECLSPYAAKLITNNINIPTIGIGSSSYCDGQILVTDDMLGFSGFYPKFVKKYANLNSIIAKATKKYTKEVRLNKFPSKNNFLYGIRNKR